MCCLVQEGGTGRSRSTAPRKGKTMRMISKKAGGTSAVGLALGAAMMMAQPAAAAVFDFKAIANGGGFTDSTDTAQLGDEASWPSLVGSGVGIKNGGISVVGTGTGNIGDGAFSLDAYFDAGAGLGVCGKYFANGECDPSNDDNVGGVGGTGKPGMETLILDFGQKVKLDEVNFVAEGHGDFLGDLEISVDGGSTITHTGTQLVNFVTSGQIFSFSFILSNPYVVGNEFYIGSMTVSEVPLPLGFVLLGSALAGLGVAGRRRKAA